MSMLNPFRMKRYAVLCIGPFFGALAYMIGFRFYGVMGALGFFFASFFLFLIIGSLMLKNPFTAMLEGQGILGINLDSTGILHPFIIAVKQPYLYGKVGGKKFRDVFDRESVFQISEPEATKTPAEIKDDGTIVLTLDKTSYNKARFGFINYPVIIYNQQIDSVLTKDFLAGLERDAFAEHTILYLNRSMEELTASVRDFARYVVESLKPKTDIWSKWWIWVIIAGLGIILLALFWPKISAALGLAKGSGQAIQTAISNATLTPR